MNTADFGQSYRSTIIFLVICLLCVISLITDTSTSPIKNAIKGVVYIITTPLVLAKSTVSNGINTLVDSLFEPNFLRAENSALKEENQRLRLALLERAEREYQTNLMHKLSTNPEGWANLKMIRAKVLEVYQGALRVDKGLRDGVQVSQGVIVPEGVVGIVIEATHFTSVIATLHHRECRIGAMIQRFRLRAYDGVIYPSGDLKKICTMNYIDINDKVLVGDLVVTSPESIFPPGIPIGTIQSIHETGTLWKSAEVIPAVDPYRLDYVFIIIEKITIDEVTPAESEGIVVTELQSQSQGIQLPIQELLAP